jgi:hypothetical protein
VVVAALVPAVRVVFFFMMVSPCVGRGYSGSCCVRSVCRFGGPC